MVTEQQSSDDIISSLQVEGVSEVGRVSHPAAYPKLSSNALISKVALLAMVWYFLAAIFVAHVELHHSRVSNITVAIARTTEMTPYRLCGFWLVFEAIGGAPRGSAVITTLLITGCEAAATYIGGAADDVCRFVVVNVGIFMCLVGCSFCSQHPKIMLTLALLPLLLDQGVMLVQSYQRHLTSMVPAAPAGIYSPMCVVVYEFGGYMVAKCLWKYCSGAASACAMTILAAFIVIGAESLRISALLSALSRGDGDSEIVMQCAITVAIGTLASILKHSQLLGVLYQECILRREYRASAEDDLFLRTHFGFKNIPTFAVLWLPFPLLCGDASGPQKMWKVGLIFSVNLCGKFLGDCIVVLMQRSLYRARSVTVPHSNRDILFRLRHIPSGHLAPSFYLPREGAVNEFLAEPTADDIDKLHLSSQAFKQLPSLLCTPADQVAGALLAMMGLHMLKLPVWQALLN